MRHVAVITALARKDFSIWRRRPIAILTTLTPSIMYVVVVYYISVSVGTPPIAVIPARQGNGDNPVAVALGHSGGFRADVTSAGRARRELTDMKAAALVTVPTGYERSARTGGPLRVSIDMNNLNEDIANDLRRSLALALLKFAGTIGSPAPIAVSEHNTHARSISLAQFRLLPGLVLILMIAGVLNTSLATCQEFELNTFTQLALAPTPTWTLVAGKIAGGWLTTVMIGSVMWTVGLTSGLIAPSAGYLLPALVMSAVVGLAASCVGVAIGAGVRQFQLVTSLSVMVALYLFFLAGGVTVLAFLPRALQAVTRYDPLYYANQGLEQVVLDRSVREYGRDLAVMLGFAGAGALLSAAVLRRSVSES